jgi:hypothetical protein
MLAPPASAKPSNVESQNSPPNDSMYTEDGFTIVSEITDVSSSSSHFMTANQMLISKMISSTSLMKPYLKIGNSAGLESGEEKRVHVEMTQDIKIPKEHHKKKHRKEHLLLEKD